MTRILMSAGWGLAMWGLVIGMMASHGLLERRDASVGQPVVAGMAAAPSAGAAQARSVSPAVR